MRGLRAAYRHEQAFRQEIWAGSALVVLACLLPVDATGRVLMIGSVVLVFVVELLNSAIEAAIDRISPELHPLSRRAKDMGSAAVCVALVNVVATWICVLLG
jgi:diacylglycerol kinase (ATP)